MKVESINVYWEHSTYVPSEKQVVFRETTTCYIEDRGELQCFGTVGRYFKDKPNKKIAIRESFKKAVNKIPYKELRTKLWNSFIASRNMNIK